MPKIKKIDHIAIVVSSLEESVEFYQEQLGLMCSHTEKLEDRGIEVAFIPVGDTKIELIAPLHDKSQVSGFLSKKGGGLHHLCFESEDVDADMDELREKGVRLTTDKVQDGAHNCRVAFVHPKSSGGVLIELSTPQS